MSWLLGSISQDIMPYLIGCSSSYEVWQKLDSLYSSNNQANIMQYKMELSSPKKGGLAVTQYLLKIKSLVDALGYVGYVVSTNDHIMHILSGLGNEFDPFVMTVTSKIGKYDAYILSEIESLLLTFEKEVKEMMDSQ